MNAYHNEVIYDHALYYDIVFIVLSGPSAGGKTMLSKTLCNDFPISMLLKKHTDRAPRAAEKDGHDYYFCSTESFNYEITPEKAFVRVERYKHLYGLTISEVDRAIKAKKIPMFILDPDAALKFREIYKNSILIFVGPDSINTIAQRIRNRKEDKEEENNKRLLYISDEYKLRPLFNLVFDNNYLSSEICKCIYNEVQNRRLYS